MSVDLEEMEVEADALALEGLVTVSEDLEPYVLEWPDLHTMDGASEAFVLVVMKRRAGVLLAVPEGFIPASFWRRQIVEKRLVQLGLPQFLSSQGFWWSMGSSIP